MCYISTYRGYDLYCGVDGAYLAPKLGFYYKANDAWSLHCRIDERLSP